MALTIQVLLDIVAGADVDTANSSYKQKDSGPTRQSADTDRMTKCEDWEPAYVISSEGIESPKIEHIAGQWGDTVRNTAQAEEESANTTVQKKLQAPDIAETLLEFIQVFADHHGLDSRWDPPDLPVAEKTHLVSKRKWRFANSEEEPLMKKMLTSSTSSSDIVRIDKCC